MIRVSVVLIYRDFRKVFFMSVAEFTNPVFGKLNEGCAAGDANMWLADLFMILRKAVGTLVDIHAVFSVFTWLERFHNYRILSRTTLEKHLAQ